LKLGVGLILIDGIFCQTSSVRRRVKLAALQLQCTEENPVISIIKVSLKEVKT